MCLSSSVEKSKGLNSWFFSAVQLTQLWKRKQIKTRFNFQNLSIYQQLLVKNMHFLSELLRRKYTEGGYKWLTREYWSHHMIDCVTGKFITNIGETFEIQLIEICNIAHLHSFDQRQKKSICIRNSENAV